MFEDLTRQTAHRPRRRWLLAGSALAHLLLLGALALAPGGDATGGEQLIDVLFTPPAPAADAKGTGSAATAPAAPVDEHLHQPVVPPDAPAAAPPADATAAGAATTPGSATGAGADLPADAGGGVTRPEIIATSRTLPDYPVEAQRAGIEGVVVLKTVIDENGRVTDVHLLRGLGHGLDEAAIAAVRHWRFHPSTQNGTPVKVFYILSVYFHL